MSGEAQKQDEPQTEAELNEKIDAELEASADEIFGAEGEQSTADQAAEAEAEAGEGQVKATDGEPGDQDEKPAEGEEDTTGKAAEGEQSAADKEGEGEASSEAKDDQYHIPDDIKGRTRERMEKFRDDLKVANDEIKKRDQTLEGFKNVLDNTGLTPKEIQSTLDLGALIKKDPAAALKSLQGIVTDLSAQVGEIPPGADPLEGYDDLKQRVADRELSQEDATELAKARTKQAAADRNKDLADKQRQDKMLQDEQNQQANADFGVRVDTAKKQVAEFLGDAEKDPDWDSIGKRMVDAAKFAAAKLAPEDWLGYLKSEHQKIKDIASSVSPGGGGTPLVDGGSPPGGDKQPNTLEDLADQML